MSLTQELRDKHADLWQRMVFHPFIVEMGDGTLSHERARRYFLQDYVFVNDLVAMIAHGTAKAPQCRGGKSPVCLPIRHTVSRERGRERFLYARL